LVIEQLEPWNEGMVPHEFYFRFVCFVFGDIHDFGRSFFL